MVRIDDCIFDLHQIHDHFSRWRQTLVQYDLHNVAYPRMQFVIVGQFGDIDFYDHPSQLFINLVCAVETWFEKTSNLLSHEYFKSTFWHEETRMHSTCVLDRSLNILFSQILKGVD